MDISIEAARDLMSRIADNLPQVLSVRGAADWDESKHPRVPEGDKGGGEFTDGKGGGTTLAKAAEKKSSIGSAEKKFKPKGGDFAAEQGAKAQFDSTLASVQAHYTADGWKEVKRVGAKREWTIEYEKDGHTVTVRTSAHDTVDRFQGRTTDRRNQTYYSINVNHTKPHRSAADLVEARALAINDEDADIEFIEEQEMRTAGSDSGPLRSLRATAGKVRRASLFGEPHLVVPVRALVEGVIFAHGAAAPEFVPAASYGRIPKSWDVRPVMAGHPQLNGQMVSAAHPDILDAHQIGWTFASQLVDGTALDMEAWINERRATLLGGDAADVVTRLNKGQAIEVSVGAHVEVDSTRFGEHNGKAYRGAWTSAAPDHLAFLKAGDRGACSIEMGCGAQRAAAEAADVTTLNRAACDGKDHTPDGSHHTDGTPCACDHGANTTNARKETRIMDDTRIAALIASPKNAYTDIHKPFLASLSDDQFKALETADAAAPTPKTEEEIRAAVQADLESKRPTTAAAYVDAAPAEIRDFLAEGLRAGAARKAGQVAQLKALGAARCPWTDAELTAMSSDSLDRLIAVAGVKVETAAVDYSGAAPRAAADASDKDNVYTNPPDPWKAAIEARAARRVG